jgi:hypothetical protein
LNARKLPGGKAWLVRKSDNFTALSECTFEYMGASTPQNPVGPTICWTHRITF